MSKDEREYLSLDEHADITLRNTLHCIKAFNAAYTDVVDIRAIDQTVVFRSGPTTYRPELPRRRVTISVAVKVEEE